MRVKYLDVLKAFAIVAVVLYHSGFLTYGYLGVDLFLVINGFLITKSLYRKVFEISTSGNVFVNKYISFEISRMVRLLPILLVAGLFCLLLGYVAMLPDDYENLSQSVIATNFFGNNILAAITTENYWDVANDFKPLMHTWYVGVVMQFYLVYPLLFYLARLDKRTPEKTLLIMVSTLAVVSLLIYWGTESIAQRFYYIPSRFFEFAAGGIVALLPRSSEGRLFPKLYVYVCYALLLALFVANYEIIPANIKLFLVVALSCVLVMSQDVLSKGIFSNKILAGIGMASYSIFVWHQVFLAFYRYSIDSRFTIWTYLLFIILVGLVSWLSYRFIEQNTNKWLSSKNGKRVFYSVIIALFVLVNSFAGYIYMNAGVVRDIPELYVSINNKHRGMHAEYNDRAYKYNRPFNTDKKHWLVIGNSYGRDFVNVILESKIADQVEVSYITVPEYKNANIRERFAAADKVWLSTLGLSEELVLEVEATCLANGLNTNDLVIVGEKNFGASNGQVYAKRNHSDYFQQTVKMEPGFEERNEKMKVLYGERYLDLISFVAVGDGKVRVFSDDHHYISADCGHFSRGGAIYYADLINWNKYLNDQTNE